jgi:hypothetical protein
MIILPQVRLGFLLVKTSIENQSTPSRLQRNLSTRFLRKNSARIHHHRTAGTDGFSSDEQWIVRIAEYSDDASPVFGRY